MRAQALLTLAVICMVAGCGNDREIKRTSEGEVVTPLLNRERIPQEALEDREGVIVDSETGEPINGIVEGKYTSGAKKFEMEVRDGLPAGLLKIWDTTGTKRVQARYTSGNLGSVTTWGASGQRLGSETERSRAHERLLNPFEGLLPDPTDENTLVDGLMPPGFTPYPENGNEGSPVTPIESEESIVTAHPSELRSAGGNLYWRETNEPFTGRVAAEYDDHSSYEQFYQDGQPHGRSTSFFSNGQKNLEEFFVDGMKQGSFTAWHQNGQRKFETTIEDGRQIGISQHFNDEGELIARWEYTEDGRIVNAMPEAEEP